MNRTGGGRVLSTTLAIATLVLHAPVGHAMRQSMNGPLSTFIPLVCSHVGQSCNFASVGSPCHVPCPHNVSVDVVHRVLSRARASHAMTMRMRVVNCPQKVRTRDGRKEAHRLAQAADRRTCRNSRAPTASTCMAQTRTRSDLTSSSAMGACCEWRVDVFVVEKDVG